MGFHIATLRLEPAQAEASRMSLTAAPFAAEFANASAGGKFVTADGSWLKQPTAVLRATDPSGNMKSALLSLAQPSYDVTSGRLTFQARPDP